MRVLNIQMVSHTATQPPPLNGRPPALDIDAASLPPLNPGDRLSRAEFEWRYHAHPEIKKAELIEGEVYMPSPVRFHDHSHPHSAVVTWLGIYEAATPGVWVGDNATVRLDYANEVQPDALLRLMTSLGGTSHVAEDGYLEGPPELVVEVAASSTAYDLHAKLNVYQRSGVQEYLVLQMYERRADWFILRSAAPAADGVYTPLEPDTEGVLHSEVFPGLALQPGAVWPGDIATLLTTLQAGLESQEHVDFVARIQRDLSS